jgi:hypothetical protein
MITYSRDYQDLFVNLITNKKQNGFYLEIGAAHPIKGNNTYLLEKDFNWIGVSIEIDKNMCDLFSKIRKNKIICNDATKLDYKKILEEEKMPKEIDYLQVDCEPALTTFEALKKIPLDDYKFSVITFEHDNYNYKENNNNYLVKQMSREYLSKFGYIMIADEMSCKGKENKPFEDWWIYPDLINKDNIEKFKEVNGLSKEVGSYVLKRLY